LIGLARPKVLWDTVRNMARFRFVRRRTAALLLAVLIIVVLSACGDSDDGSSGGTSDRNAAASTPTGICLINASGNPLEVTFADNIFLDGKGPRVIPSTGPGACAGTDDSTSAKVRRPGGSDFLRIDIGMQGNGEYANGSPRSGGLYVEDWCAQRNQFNRSADAESFDPRIGWTRTFTCEGFVITLERTADVGARISLDVRIRAA